MHAGISGAPSTETRISTTERDPQRLDLFAIAAPGLEPLVARELRSLGIPDAHVEPGGVAFTGGREALYRANLHLRTASRVVAHVGAFEARGFAELVRHARRQPWECFLDAQAPVRLRVTCRKSKLYHSDAVAERVLEAIAARIGGEVPTVDDGADEDGDSAAQLIIVRLVQDRCLLRVDSSGELLHRRGYRAATAKAPLRVTLAAALLLASEWRTSDPLLDPFCGSGTIPIEAAMLARRMAPGFHRSFAFATWPDFDARLWHGVREEAQSAVLPNVPAPIIGSDRDAGAIEAATANAARARVSGDLQFIRRALSAMEPPSASDAGCVCTNPPYGARVSKGADLRNLYAQLGHVMRARFAGWTLAMFSPEPAFDRATGLPLATVVKTVNGGIPVRIVKGTVLRSRIED